MSTPELPTIATAEDITCSYLVDVLKAREANGWKCVAMHVRRSEYLLSFQRMNTLLRQEAPCP